MAKWEVIGSSSFCYYPSELLFDSCIFKFSFLGNGFLPLLRASGLGLVVSTSPPLDLCSMSYSVTLLNTISFLSLFVDDLILDLALNLLSPNLGLKKSFCSSVTNNFLRFCWTRILAFSNVSSKFETCYDEIFWVSSCCYSWLITLLILASLVYSRLRSPVLVCLFAVLLRLNGFDLWEFLDDSE